MVLPLNKNKCDKKISFGSQNDRTLFPEKAFDRLSNQLGPTRGSPQLGPGKYENQKYTSMHHKNQSHYFNPHSNSGYYLNRTEPRLFKLRSDVPPDPGTYQNPVPGHPTKLSHDPDGIPKYTSESRFGNQPKNCGFTTTEKRFTKKKIDTDFTPGPGYYNSHELNLNRRVRFPQAFGKIDDKYREELAGPDAKKVLRTTLAARKENIKRSNRLAYFKLYF